MKYLIALFAVCLNAQTISTGDNLCRVEGKVVDAQTGAPLKKATMILRNIEKRRDTEVTSVSDAAGQFSFSDVAPGHYTLTAMRMGYIAQPYREKGLRRGGSVFQISKGQVLGDVEFALVPQAAITGKITDEDGDPLMRANLYVLKYGYSDGGKRLTMVATSSTNDLGEYRAFGLEPGRYYVSASAVNSAAPSSPARTGYAKTYYPNATSTDAASVLSVSAGALLRGIDLKLANARVYAIHGRVSGGIPPHTVATLGLSQRERPAMDRPIWARPNEDGEFLFAGLPPGSYVISSSIQDRGRELIVRAPVDVMNSNVDGVVVSYAPLSSIKGLITVENDADLQNEKLSVELSSRGSAFPGMSNSEVEADRSFTFDSLAPNTYELSVNNLPKNFYVKSARLGETDVTGSFIDISSTTSAELNITVSATGAAVEGTVLNAAQEPVDNAEVVLIPESDKRQFRALYKVRRTNAKGRFSLQGIRPGDYKLFAWEQIGGEAYRDADFLKPFEPRGQSVSLKENAHETVQVTVIPADETAATFNP